MANLTEQAILEAFVRQLSERPLDKITVTDLAAECQITRRTFYYHFRDLLDVVERLLKIEIDAAIREFRFGASWQECFIRASRFVLDNRRAVYHLYRSAHRDELERYVRCLSMEVMRRYLAELSRGRDVKPDDFEMICQFYKSALYGLVMEWLERGMQDDPERIVRRIGELFDGGLMHAITVSEQS